MVKGEIRRLEKKVAKASFPEIREEVYLEWLWDAVEFVTRKENVR